MSPAGATWVQRMFGMLEWSNPSIILHLYCKQVVYQQHWGMCHLFNLSIIMQLICRQTVYKECLRMLQWCNLSINYGVLCKQVVYNWGWGMLVSVQECGPEPAVEVNDLVITWSFLIVWKFSRNAWLARHTWGE